MIALVNLESSSNRQTQGHVAQLDMHNRTAVAYDSRRSAPVYGVQEINSTKGNKTIVHNIVRSQLLLSLAPTSIIVNLELNHLHGRLGMKGCLGLRGEVIIPLRVVKVPWQERWHPYVLADCMSRTNTNAWASSCWIVSEGVLVRALPVDELHQIVDLSAPPLASLDPTPLVTPYLSAFLRLALV